MRDMRDEREDAELKSRSQCRKKGREERFERNVQDDGSSSSKCVYDFPKDL